MTPRNRLLATLKGENHDRVPLTLEGFSAAELVDNRDPAATEIIGRIIDQTHFSVSCPAHVNRYMVTPPHRITTEETKQDGGTVTSTIKVDTPKGDLTAITANNTLTNTTWMVKYPVESLSDIDKIRSVPWELPRAVAPPDLSDLPASFDERGIVESRISSPFVCVAGMMPYDYFLELCATELTLLKELTAQCLERIIEVLDVILADKNVEYVWMGGCEWLTPPMGSPALYEELVQPFERKIIDQVHAAGALCHVHCHGNVRSTLELVIERGADYFEPVEPPPDGDITFAEAKAIANDRITLGGNLEARIIENEDVDTVERAVREAFAGGKSRMILKTTAGVISDITPHILQNYHRMIDLWEELAVI